MADILHVEIFSSLSEEKMSKKCVQYGGGGGEEEERSGRAVAPCPLPPLDMKPYTCRLRKLDLALLATG